MKTGHIVFALALAGLGIMGQVHGDFALQWQPIAAGLPGRQALAYLSGAMLLVGGIGLLVRPAAVRCAGALAIYLLLCWVLPQIIKAAASPPG